MEAPQHRSALGAEVERRYLQIPPAVGAHEQAKALERMASAAHARTEPRFAQLELAGVPALARLRLRFQ